MDLRGYEWRLEKAILVLESARRGLRQHIYIGLGLGKVSKIINYGIFRNLFLVQK